MDGARVELTVTEFGILRTLLEQPGPRPHARDSSSSSVRDADTHITERTVDTHVRRIRAKLRAARLRPDRDRARPRLQGRGAADMSDRGSRCARLPRWLFRIRSRLLLVNVLIVSVPVLGLALRALLRARDAGRRRERHDPPGARSCARCCATTPPRGREALSKRARRADRHRRQDARAHPPARRAGQRGRRLARRTDRPRASSRAAARGPAHAAAPSPGGPRRRPTRTRRRAGPGRRGPPRDPARARRPVRRATRVWRWPRYLSAPWRASASTCSRRCRSRVADGKVAGVVYVTRSTVPVLASMHRLRSALLQHPARRPGDHRGAVAVPGRHDRAAAAPLTRHARSASPPAIARREPASRAARRDRRARARLRRDGAAPGRARRDTRGAGRRHQPRVQVAAHQHPRRRRAPARGRRRRSRGARALPRQHPGRHAAPRSPGDAAARALARSRPTARRPSSSTPADVVGEARRRVRRPRRPSGGAPPAGARAAATAGAPRWSRPCAT